MKKTQSELNKEYLKFVQQRLERLEELKLFARNKLHQLEVETKEVKDLIETIKKRITTTKSPKPKSKR